MKKETFKPYPKNPNYLVSDAGNVYSLHRMRNVGSDTMYGYRAVLIDYKWIGVHRVVYETWKGEIPEGYEVHHVNSLRKDNRPENLEAVTKAKNIQHMHQARKNPKPTKLTTSWKGYWQIESKKYSTLKEAEQATGIPQARIRSWCMKGTNNCGFIEVARKKTA